MNPQPQGNDDEHGMEVHTLTNEEGHDQGEQQALDQYLVVLFIKRVAGIAEPKRKSGMNCKQQVEPGHHVALVVAPWNPPEQQKYQGEHGKYEVHPRPHHEAIEVCGGRQHSSPPPKQVGIEGPYQCQGQHGKQHQGKRQITHVIVCRLGLQNPSLKRHPRKGRHPKY